MSGSHIVRSVLWAACACGLLFAPALAGAQKPRVVITSPTGGYTSDRVVQITGYVQGAKTAQLVVNGAERPLQLMGGGDRRDFKATLLAPPGHNTIIVQARNKRSTGKASVSFFAKVPRLDLSVVLSWDTDGTDLDLHVVDPANEECFYGHRITEAGGKLDVDDTDGFGPEVFTLANALEGAYTIKVKYYSDNGHPQSLVTVDVIMYEGTDSERRERFEAMLTRTGEIYEVGTFKVSPGGI